MTAISTRLAVALAALAALAPAARASVASTERASLSNTGAQLNGWSTSPAISADGRWVAFASDAGNAVEGDNNGWRDVFLRDRKTGETRRISQRPGGDSKGFATSPSISNDGRYVAFVSTSEDLTPGAHYHAYHAYLYDRADGGLHRLDTNLTGGDGRGAALDPQVSPDGTHVVFESRAGNLVEGDTGGWVDVFDYEIASGRLRRVTTFGGDSHDPDVSAGGRYVAFSSDATDVAGADGNGAADVFVRDMQTGATERVSVPAGGGEAAGKSEAPSISADGCVVAFNSTAKNLVATDDRTGRLKAFVRDRCAGNTELVSIGRKDGQDVQGAVYGGRRPALSDDGRVVAFLSNDVTSPAPAGYAAVLRDRYEGTTSRLDIGNDGQGGDADADHIVLSGGPGRFAAFSSASTTLVQGDTNGVGDAFVRDLATPTPPVADIRVTVEGLRVSVDASSSHDPDGATLEIRTSFGDGSPDQAGTTATHVYTRGGSHTVAVRVTDADGLSDVATRTVDLPDTPVAAGPATSAAGAASFDPAPPAFQPAAPPARASAAPSSAPAPALQLALGALKADRKRRARLAATVSEAATLEVTYVRLVPGRKAGGRCIAHASLGKRCTIARAVGTAKAAVHAGDNAVTGRALTRGRYRLCVVARAADGRVSDAVTRTLTIKE